MSQGQEGGSHKRFVGSAMGALSGGSSTLIRPRLASQRFAGSMLTYPALLETVEGDRQSIVALLLGVRELAHSVGCPSLYETNPGPSIYAIHR
jgi:hypothetical protein